MKTLFTRLYWLSVAYCAVVHCCCVVLPVRRLQCPQLRIRNLSSILITGIKILFSILSAFFIRVLNYVLSDLDFYNIHHRDTDQIKGHNLLFTEQ